MMTVPAATRTSSSLPATRARSSRESPEKIDVRVIVSMKSSTALASAPTPRIQLSSESGPRISAGCLTVDNLGPRVWASARGGPSMKLKDRVALVTGGGSGLGRAISLLFAEEGAHVIVNELSLETAKQTVVEMKSSGGGRAIQADVSDSVQVK